MGIGAKQGDSVTFTKRRLPIPGGLDGSAVSKACYHSGLVKGRKIFEKASNYLIYTPDLCLNKLSAFYHPQRNCVNHMNRIRFQEAYGKIGEADDRFDVTFWQAQGERAIFEAAEGMIRDYLLLREGHVDEPRLQRTVEFFQAASTSLILAFTSSFRKSHRPTLFKVSMVGIPEAFQPRS